MHLFCPVCEMHCIADEQLLHRRKDAPGPCCVSHQMTILVQEASVWLQPQPIEPIVGKNKRPLHLDTPTGSKQHLPPDRGS